MSHQDPVRIDKKAVAQSEPVEFCFGLATVSKLGITIGTLVFMIGFVFYPRDQFWGAFYTNLVFWMGLAAGGVIISAMFRIVNAKWAPPIRRIAESGVSFLPWALIGFLTTYFGKEYLFHWGRAPMPGREWWMQPDFVYARFTVLLSLLFFLMFRFVKLSLRADVGLAKELAGDDSRWGAVRFEKLLSDWKGSEKEIPATESTKGFFAPFLVLVYALIYSLFAFEMIMGMNPIFFSNMFGGFVFIGNILAAWAFITMFTLYLRKRNDQVLANAQTQQFHDLGKLTFGFCVLWAYLFISQFLPIWYSNMPEETQWIILRLRENPWRILAWATLAMVFVIPFLTLLSRDVKKTWYALTTICTIILCGLWLERYVVIMPEIRPDAVPFGLLEVGFFFGFMGAYLMSIGSFLKKYPIMPISDPLSMQAGH